MKQGRFGSVLLAALLAWLPLQHLHAASPQADDAEALFDTGRNERGAFALPDGVQVMRDVDYGSDPLQRFDVYLPPRPRHAPVIVMVHGGGWSRGDKAMRSVVQNKVARWVPRGFILISVDYRLLPQAGVQAQLEDLALAVATAQQRVADWGGDGRRLVLIGHSAGAHLAALLGTEAGLVRARGGWSWLGTVSLDSAALDVPQVMQSRHLRLYDRAFGDDPAYWAQVSPLQQLRGPIAPMLLVCSTRRSDSCPQARQFAAVAQGFHSRTPLLPEDLSHRQINQELGLESDYTRAVERFMASLDAGVARQLAGVTAPTAGLPVITHSPGTR